MLWRVLIALAAAILSGCGQEGSGETAVDAEPMPTGPDVTVRQVVERLADQSVICTGVKLSVPLGNAEQVGWCTVGHKPVQIATFGNADQRFEFLASRGDEGWLVAGRRWVVGTNERALAERIRQALGGELRRGAIFIQT